MKSANEIVQKIIESGLYQIYGIKTKRLLSAIYPPLISTQNGKQRKALNMKQLEGVFYVYLGGVSISAAVFCLEIIYSKLIEFSLYKCIHK